MRILPRLAVALYMTFLVYIALVIVFGDSGILATKQLCEYEKDLRENVENLKIHNALLAEEFTALRESSEMVKIRARTLGYYDSNEGVIHPEGFKARSNFYAVGNFITSSMDYTADKKILRTLSVSAGIILFIFLIVVRKREQGNKRTVSRES